MDDWDWATPIALTGQTPIAQAVFDLPLTQTLRLKVINGRINGFLTGGLGNPCKMVDKDHFLGFGGNQRLGSNRGVIAGHMERVLHRQVVFAGKIQVALVMRRTAEHSPGTIVHQHKIPDPDR